MTNKTAAGKGWWLASDGEWYPPEQHPDADHEHHARRWHPAGSAFGAHGRAAGSVLAPVRRSVAVERHAQEFGPPLPIPERPHPPAAVATPGQTVSSVDGEPTSQKRTPVVSATPPEQDSQERGWRQAPTAASASASTPLPTRGTDLFEQALKGGPLPSEISLVKPGQESEGGPEWNPLAKRHEPDESDVALNPDSKDVGTFRGAKVRRRWRPLH